MLSDQVRSQHVELLKSLTQIPTAAGREWRVIRAIRAWAGLRPDVVLRDDPSGNLHLTLKSAPAASDLYESARRPIYFTAHLDHPAFVVDQIVNADSLLLSFRGGVMADYFTNAKVRLFNRADYSQTANIIRKEKSAPPFDQFLATLDSGTNEFFAVGDIARWDLPAAEIIDNCLYTDACDDLAAAAAALAAFDILRTRSPREDVRLLFTRSEEIGFIGAIAACHNHTMPMNARVIALENSRAFPDSPVHGGPVVRVGDRVCVFSPSLSAACARRAEELGGPQPTAKDKISDSKTWKWQRKLMAGGACESSVFCTLGYEATCICLPLGNYHNMGDLAAIQNGTATRPATIEREFIGIDDFHGLVDLLIACGEKLEEGSGFSDRVSKLWNDLNFVLEES